MKIKTAIFPVAGFGTRCLPATKALPKEMLPVVGKPALQILVEDAVRAGIERVIFVTGRGKGAIEDHFDYSHELDSTLVEKGKEKLVEEVRGIAKLADFNYVRQPMPLGDGDAIKRALSGINESEPILVIFGDTLYKSKVSVAQQVISTHKRCHGPVVALTEVANEKVSDFGVIDGVDMGDGLFSIKKFVEKPEPEKAPSNLVAVGAYVLTPSVFLQLKEMKSENKMDSLRLSDVFVKMLANKEVIYGKKMEGTWLDTGDTLGNIKANISLGIDDPKIGSKLKKFLKQIAGKL